MAAKPWRPPKELPPAEKLEAYIGQLDEILAQRPWVAENLVVDNFATNYAVHALEMLLVAHGILSDEEIAYYNSLIEYDSKRRTEEASREAPADWAPPSQPKTRVLLPGRDF